MNKLNSRRFHKIQSKTVALKVHSKIELLSC